MTYQKIDRDTLKKWLDDNRKFVLIDVLPGEFYTAKHLPNAQNACVYEVVFFDNISKIVSEKSQPIVVYSSNSLCQASTLAAERLAAVGYTDVFEYEGGLDDWARAGYALEGEDFSAWDKDQALWQLPDKTYRADPEASQIEWVGRNINGKHEGTLDLAEGEVTVENGRIAGGHFIIDMNAMTCSDLKDAKWNRILIDHLKSDDFFDVATYPQARFEVSQVDALQNVTPGAANYRLTGSLTLKGVTHDITFPAFIAHREDGSLIAEAHFDIDRTRWNVRYGSGKFFAKLGKHLVNDVISLELRMVAR